MAGEQAWPQQYTGACVPVFKVVVNYRAQQLRLHNCSLDSSLWNTAEQLAQPQLIAHTTHVQQQFLQIVYTYDQKIVFDGLRRILHAETLQ
jgi:hypothetical protein